MSKKVPSPCIDVCKFKRAGHCIGCSMTKNQKKTFKKLDKRDRMVKFVRQICEQQSEMGKYKHWEIQYRKKCIKKNLDCPIDGF